MQTDTTKPKQQADDAAPAAIEVSQNGESRAVDAVAAGGNRCWWLACMMASIVLGAVIIFVVLVTVRKDDTGSSASQTVVTVGPSVGDSSTNVIDGACSSEGAIKAAAGEFSHFVQIQFDI